MSSSLPPNEDDLEQWNLDLLKELGWARVYGRDIEPGGGLPERGDWPSAILPQRLTAAIAKLNPQLPALRLVKVGVCVRLRVRMGRA